MIAEMKVGETVVSDLLIKDAQVKFTKSQKPYLYLVLFDGVEDIQAQDWDYGDNPALEKGTVLRLEATVTEFAGNKQLKLKRHKASEKPVEDYAPQGGVDLDWYEMMLTQLIDSVENEHASRILDDVFHKYDWSTVPAANSIHHAFVSGLLKHTVDVTRKAKAIAELVPTVNKDLVVAGALLHDLGKLWTYKLNGALIEMTEQGQMIEHLAIGIMKLEEYRTEDNSAVVDLLQHIVSSHHGKREYGSPTTPLFIEAMIVNAADEIDAKTQTVLEANAKATGKQTDKIWIMENRKMFTQDYIQSIMEA